MRVRNILSNVPRLESGRPLLNEEAADFIVFAFRPDECDIGDRVTDPHFFTEDVAISFFRHEGAFQRPDELGLLPSENKSLMALPFCNRGPFLFRASEPNSKIAHHEPTVRNEAAQRRIAAFDFLRHRNVLQPDIPKYNLEWPQRAPGGSAICGTSCAEIFPSAIVLLDYREDLLRRQTDAPSDAPAFLRRSTKNRNRGSPRRGIGACVPGRRAHARRGLRFRPRAANNSEIITARQAFYATRDGPCHNVGLAEPVVPENCRNALWNGGRIALLPLRIG